MKSCQQSPDCSGPADHAIAETADTQPDIFAFVRTMRSSDDGPVAREPPELGIERIAEAIPEQVNPQHRHRERQIQAPVSPDNSRRPGAYASRRSASFVGG